MTTDTITEDRATIDRPEAAEPAGLSEVPPGVPGRPAPTRLFGLAVIIVVVAFLGSLITLAIHAPNGGNHSLLSGPAVAAGVVGMYSAVAGGLLGFLVAVRSEDAQ